MLCMDCFLMNGDASTLTSAREEIAACQEQVLRGEIAALVPTECFPEALIA